MSLKNGLKIDERRKKILEILRRDGQVKVSELKNFFDVSAVTIRSDLDILGRDGFLERTQGGAIQTVKNFYNFEFQCRKQENMEQKKAIASVAADLINDGETLLINSGTTTYYTAVELKRHKNLNIVTNSVSVAIELGAHPTFHVILLGGDINAQYSFTYGKDAQEQLGRYKADKSILSVDGICIDSGLTTYHAEEALVNNTMIDRARETIIVADSSKFDHESFAFITEIEKAQYWVTDSLLNSQSVNEIEKLGIKVVI
jgi:DeoR/GlpR family transcriptional regulator of sugar metabolism